MARYYETLPTDVREHIDEAFNAATEKLREAGYHTAYDDNAEQLVDAIAEYVKESNPGRALAWEGLGG